MKKIALNKNEKHQSISKIIDKKIWDKICNFFDIVETKITGSLSIIIIWFLIFFLLVELEYQLLCQNKTFMNLIIELNHYEETMIFGYQSNLNLYILDAF